MLAKLAIVGLCIGSPWLQNACAVLAADQGYTVRQISFGPRHHFFGYIGHVGTVPWNASGRYIVALRVGDEDHLPGPTDVAEIVLVDTDSRKVAGQLGSPADFPQPGGDIALSPNGTRLVNGYGNRRPGENTYAILSRQDNRLIRTRGFSRGGRVSGALRIDPAPRWNRRGDQILISAISDDPEQTRQLYVISLEE